MKDLNLIPKSFINEKRNRRKKAYLSVLIICIGIAAALTYIFPTVYEFKLRTEKQQLEQQVSQSNNYVEMKKEFDSLSDAVEKRENEGKLLAAKEVNMPGILKAIELAAPEKLFVQNIETSMEDQSGIKISLKGVAEDDRTIASFIRNLMDDGYFSEVTLAGIFNKQGNNGSSFEINLSGIRKSDLNVYDGWDSGFSISYPQDWNIKEKSADKVKLAAAKSLNTAEPASLEVSVEPADTNVQSFTDARKKELEGSLKQFEFKYSNLTRYSGVDAYKLMYFAEEDNIRYQYLEICVIKNRKAYIATYRSDAVSFENKARTIDRILKSFTID